MTVQAQGISITDDRGRVERFAAPPQRIVTLLPSLAESVCALGHCAKLVGVDRYTTWPASLAKLPKLGGGMDPNIEAIVAARPDVVLMAKSTRAHERLQALGRRVLVFEPTTYQDVQRTLTELDKLLNPDSPRAPVLWAQMQAQLAATAQRLPERARGQLTYFEAGLGLYAAGEASFIGQTLKALGARNIVPASMGPFPHISPEYVVAANPQLIFVGEKGAADLPKRPGWADISAVKRQRLCVLSAAQADVVVRPGPRMAEAAEVLAGCMARLAP